MTQHSMRYWAAPSTSLPPLVTEAAQREAVRTAYVTHLAARLDTRAGWLANLHTTVAEHSGHERTAPTGWSADDDQVSLRVRGRAGRATRRARRVDQRRRGRLLPGAELSRRAHASRRGPVASLGPDRRPRRDRDRPACAHRHLRVGGHRPGCGGGDRATLPLAHRTTQHGRPARPDAHGPDDRPRR